MQTVSSDVSDLCLALALGLALGPIACGPDAHLETSDELEEVSPSALSERQNQAPIALLRAHSRNYLSWGGGSWTHSDYTMLVQNLAYDKEVGVRLRQQGGNWTDVPARYMGRADGDREIWRAEIEESRDAGAPPEHEFAVWYRVNGVTYWDNNRNANYKFARDSGALLANGTNVLLYNARSMGPPLSTKVDGRIHLRNLAYRKTVEVVYSEDDWATVHRVPAQWSSGPNTYGCEIWRFETGDVQLDKMKFAVAYTVDGRTYWDNNFGMGRDYRFIPTAQTNATCSANLSANGAADGNACWW